MKKIVGVDEVGRGALAGPIVACAVAVQKPQLFPHHKIKDSKLLSDAQRRRLAPLIYASCAVSFGIVSHQLIDRLRIQAANVLAIDQALAQFVYDEYELHSDYVGSFERLTLFPHRVALHVHGESALSEIAAASIVAKVYRDDLMQKFGVQMPEYFFEQHKGYGTKQHRKQIMDVGVSSVHRKTFRLTTTAI